MGRLRRKTATNQANHQVKKAVRGFENKLTMFKKRKLQWSGQVIPQKRES